MTKYATFGMTFIRHWDNPESWMVNGYSSTHEVVALPPSAQTYDVPAGGWSLRTSDLVRIEWWGDPAAECMYQVRLIDRIAYRSLWTPKLLETVTEAFFCNDLWIINYRLLRIEEK